LFTYLFSIKFLYFVIIKFHLFFPYFNLFCQYSCQLMLTATIMFRSYIHRLIHDLFHIALDISTIPWYRPRGTISVQGWWHGQYEKSHVLIYLSHILPGQKICFCPRKTLLPRRQITRRKLCFYYTCKFGVISIKYVINTNYPQGKKLRIF
jgi:hypothetical protein